MASLSNHERVGDRGRMIIRTYTNHATPNKNRHSSHLIRFIPFSQANSEPHILHILCIDVQ